jgi:ribosomal protein S18 acetylase RimI-like enzyme/3D (Asp-Asp-Asp) domain-containing protein
MSMKPVIRFPLPEEKRLFFDVYNTGLPNLDEVTFQRFSKWWEKSIENGNLERLWRVAVLEGKIVGVVINTINEALKWGMVWELAIVPKLRDKGIGTRLVKESERLLVKHGTEITHFAIGVKTHNTRAFSLYEKLGYRARFLVLRLKGDAWKTTLATLLTIGDAETRDAGKLSRLVPDAYWSATNLNGWKKRTSEGDCRVFRIRKSSEIVGVVSLSESEKGGSATELTFSVKPSFGNAVLDATMGLVKTKKIDLWLQDNHQDIIDYAYQRGLKRIDSE